MNDNELKARRFTALCDCVVAVGTATSVVALYDLSRSWHSLWALALIPLFASYKNARALREERETGETET